MTAAVLTTELCPGSGKPAVKGRKYAVCPSCRSGGSIGLKNVPWSPGVITPDHEPADRGGNSDGMVQ